MSFVNPTSDAELQSPFSPVRAVGPLTVPASITSLEDFRRYVNARWSKHLAADFEHNVAIAALGLGGEAGEVNELLPPEAHEVGRQLQIAVSRAQEHFKKHIRNGRSLNPNPELVLELGDVLHYWLALCFAARLDPIDVMRANVEKLNDRALKGQTR